MIKFFMLVLFSDNNLLAFHVKMCSKKLCYISCRIWTVLIKDLMGTRVVLSENAGNQHMVKNNFKDATKVVMIITENLHLLWGVMLTDG